ncbi:uncharacterized protein LOC136039846 isoform X2 [Artemia franciscana]|uniref:G-protein coupled receptors family 1 profile domain-containing protein n=1 Tax=Artemia franciscana TaxID=6661 RepID=A0AA88HWV3_ARTSF|nr:hypothetical protein QYM36_010206 [Artemia franciscana]
MIGANLRFGSSGMVNGTLGGPKQFQCHPGGATEAGLLMTIASLGVAANLTLIVIILYHPPLRRWSLGLVFHQAIVDLLRGALLVPLGNSIMNCQPVPKCAILETAFILLVSVSSINLLTTVLNDTPLLAEDDNPEVASILGVEGNGVKPLEASSNSALHDAPQCVVFGVFMIWFSAITINLGPTFISGALAASAETIQMAPSCPLVQGPFRHYIVNLLWVLVNMLCISMAAFHLYKLHRDLTKPQVQAVRIASFVTTMISVATRSHDTASANEHRQVRTAIQRIEIEGLQKVKMFAIVISAYLAFWGPLFFVVVASGSSSVREIGDNVLHEIALHVAFVHAFANPALFLSLHKGIRSAVNETFRCHKFKRQKYRKYPRRMPNSLGSLPQLSVTVTPRMSYEEEDDETPTPPPPLTPSTNRRGHM